LLLAPEKRFVFLIFFLQLTTSVRCMMLMQGAHKPVKPMLPMVFCMAKFLTAHGFTGKALAVIQKGPYTKF